ncbi:MAG: PQQ-binding-like beta-propeller repeat protein [Anaerolineales bacterium]
MKIKYLVFIGLLLVLAVALSGCTALPTSWPGVSADTKNAYIAGGPYVYAVNLQTGKQVWRFPASSSAANPFYATPVLTSDGQLVVGGFDKKLYSLNPQTGQSTWQFTDAHGIWVAAVLVDNNMIYAPNADYNLYALNLQGQLQWTFAADQSIWGAPVTDETNIYFGTLGKKVYAISEQTGKQVWVQTLDGAVLGSPVLGSNSTLYVGSYGGTVYALNTDTGGTRWKVSTSSWIWSGPVLSGGDLYVGDANGKFWAFSALDGSKQWETDLIGAIIGSPFVDGNMLVVGTEVPNADTGYVYFLDNTGKIVHTMPLSGKSQLYATPEGAGKLVLVAPTGDATDPILLALDSTGTIKWPFIPPK